MTKHKIILVVEDNEMNLKLYYYILKNIKNIDLEIIAATDGEDAIKKIVDHHPSLVILDIQIPKITGLEVAKRVRADPTYKDVVIVAVTAYALKGDKEVILASGCDYYISKPIDTRIFITMVQSILNGERSSIPLIKSDTQ